MFLKIIGIFAEFERENIIERVKVGIERKVREGYSIGGNSSYGYDRPKNQKIQTINNDEAEIVQEIFDMFVNQGVAINDIARRLNVRKISTKQEATWSSTSVRRLLANTNYIGNVRHHIRDEKNGYSVEGLHDAIIDQEIFDTAQKILANNKKAAPRKRPREDNYFSGFLTCGCCGFKMVTHNIYKPLKDGLQSVTGSYRCQNKTFGVCTTSSISHKKVERAFEEYIEQIGDLDDAADIEIAAQKRQENQAQIQAYQDKYRKFETKEHEALKLYVENNLEFETYREIKKIVDKEKAAISAELEKLQEIQAEEPQISKADIVKDFRKNWSALSASQRRQFLLQFIGKIELVSERKQGERFSTVKVQDITFLPSYEKSRNITAK